VQLQEFRQVVLGDGGLFAAACEKSRRAVKTDVV